MTEDIYYIDHETTVEMREAMTESERIDYVLSIRHGLVVGGLVTRASIDYLSDLQTNNPLGYESQRRQIAEEFRVARERQANPTPPQGWVPLRKQSETDAA
jgi:hypothetical protein